MTAKVKKVIPLAIPPKIDDVDAWLVVGLDPSMSRTGYALSVIVPQLCPDVAQPILVPTKHWLDVGSVKPADAGEPIWIRGKAMALYLQDTIRKALMLAGRHHPGVVLRVGLIISMEYPTPMNDFLVALNRIIHLVFFEGDLYRQFAAVRILTVNAATMRSLMNLKMRGAANKKENILRAYEYIPRNHWPSLDTDSCDATLFTIIGEYTASIMLGYPESVPERFKNALCNANKEVKGKGTRVRIITKGLLHRSEYWYPYERKDYTLLVKDAANPKPGLRRENFII